MYTKIKMLFACLTYFAFATYGQQNEDSFIILNVGTKYSETEIKDALNGADLCGFYYIDEKRKMLFEDGAIVELKSSDELERLSENCFIKRSPAHKDEYWKIADNGHLIRIKQTYGK